MTDQEIRIAITEACGKAWHHPTEEELKSGSYYQYEPDCLNDLNIMHEAEGICIRSLAQDAKYVHILEDIASAQTTSYTRQRAAISATARQRAEALLKTTNKWID